MPKLFNLNLKFLMLPSYNNTQGRLQYSHLKGVLPLSAR